MQWANWFKVYRIKTLLMIQYSKMESFINEVKYAQIHKTLNPINHNPCRTV